LLDAAVEIVDQDLRKLLKTEHKMLLVLETATFPPHREDVTSSVRYCLSVIKYDTPFPLQTTAKTGQ